MARTLRIVFVCSGNICRSPLAAAIAQRMLDAAKIPAVTISAGTLGLSGHSAAAHTITTAAEIGLDLTSHRSQGVSLALMRMADHIVVMAPHHAQFLLQGDPTLAPRIVRLWEFARDDGQPLDHIPDPVGKDLFTFRRARDLIQQGLESWCAALKD